MASTLDKPGTFHFILKSEAYVYSVYFLQKCAKELEGDKLKELNKIIANIKRLFENHEMNLFELRQYLKRVKKHGLIPAGLSSEFDNMVFAVKNSPYQKTPAQTKYENPLRRYFDSLIATKMILDPSPETMAHVKQISDQIVRVLRYYQTLDKSKLSDMEAETCIDSLNDFLRFLQNEEDDASEPKKIRYLKAIAFGSLDKFGKISEHDQIERVIGILESNTSLPEIMNIHFKFMHTMRSVPWVGLQQQTPSGKFVNLIKTLNNSTPEEYYKNLTSSNWEGARARVYISDDQIYETSLYKNEKQGKDEHRGKLGELDYAKRSNRLGIMRENQQKYRELLPQYETDLLWVPDAIAQTTDLDSRFTKDAIESESVYVAGPSGMASLLLSVLENFGCFPNNADKFYYLNAICGYIVGGGFHSFSEVLAPAAYCLELVEDYPVKPPDMEHDTQAPAPRVGNFYQQLAKVDSHFQEIYDKSWEEFIQTFERLTLKEITARRMPVKRDRTALSQDVEEQDLEAYLAEHIPKDSQQQFDWQNIKLPPEMLQEVLSKTLIEKHKVNPLLTRDSGGYRKPAVQSLFTAKLDHHPPSFNEDINNIIGRLNKYRKRAEHEINSAWGKLGTQFGIERKKNQNLNVLVAKRLIEDLQIIQATGQYERLQDLDMNYIVQELRKNYKTKGGTIYSTELNNIIKDFHNLRERTANELRKPDATPASPR